MASSFPKRRFSDEPRDWRHEKYKPENVKGMCDKDGEKLTQRDDDSKETTLSLLREYSKDIMPILDEYRYRGILVEIDATPSIDEIQLELIKTLKL